MIKKELSKACNNSYAEYKAEKKITLDDNNINIEKNTNADETKDLTLKKKRNEPENASYLKYAMPYAQDATRR